MNAELCFYTDCQKPMAVDVNDMPLCLRHAVDEETRLAALYGDYMKMLPNLANWIKKMQLEPILERRATHIRALRIIDGWESLQKSKMWRLTHPDST